MHRTSVIFLIILPLLVGISRAAAQGVDWRFGFEYIEVDPPFATEAEHDTLLSRLAWVTGAQQSQGGINVDAIGGGWNGMQPSATAPIDFTQSDAWVRRMQDGGFELVWNFGNNAAWSYANNKHCIDGPGPDDCAPDSAHEQAWFNYVKALVERYDGDGVADMPGLKIPIRYYVMTQEIYFNGQDQGDAGEAQGVGFWDDNVDDLVRLHRLTWRAIHEADPSGRSKLVGSGGWLLDLYGDFPDYPAVDGPTIRARLLGDNLKHVTYDKGFDSLVSLMRQLGSDSPTPACDDIEWHPHSGWKSSDQSIKFVRTYAPTKPIFIDDMWSTILTDVVPNDGYLQFLSGNANERDFPNAQIPTYAALRDGLNAGDSATLAWYNGKGARDAVKCFVTVFGEGAERISYSLSNDFNPTNPVYLLSQAWRYTGLVGTKLTNYAMKPVTYTMHTLVDKLHDFTSVRRLDVGASNDTRCYRFERVRGAPCWVCWSEATVNPTDPAIPNGETVSVPVDADSVVVTHIITRAGQTTSMTETRAAPGHTFTVQLGFEPIIVEGRATPTGVPAETEDARAHLGAAASRGTLQLSLRLRYDAMVDAELYDMTGRRVATLAHEVMGPGEHRIERSTAGLAAGGYVVRMHAGGAEMRTLIMVGW